MPIRATTGSNVLVGICLLVLGMLLGILVERIRFDRQRSEVIGRYEQALRDWQSYQISLEKGRELRRTP